MMLQGRPNIRIVGLKEWLTLGCYMCVERERISQSKSNEQLTSIQDEL